MNFLTGLFGGKFVLEAALIAMLATAWATHQVDGAFAAKAQLEAVKAAAVVQAKSDAITNEANEETQRKIGYNEGFSDGLQQKVTHYVTAKDDAGCVLNNGFIKLYDSFVTGVEPDKLPGADHEPDAAPSGIALSQATALFGQNATIDRDKDAIISGWQDWAVKQKTLTQQRGKGILDSLFHRGDR